MTNIRRYHISGATYFITMVTYERQSLLHSRESLLMESVDYTGQYLPFSLIASVVLPDHAHLIIEPEDESVSAIVHRIKQRFSAQYRSITGVHAGRLWQNRFWDHIIRDQEDLKRHIDYVHYNPVKHRLASRPAPYRFSSFGEFLKRGYYDESWGERAVSFEGEFGE